MDIASMVDLIDMIKHLDEENERIGRLEPVRRGV